MGMDILINPANGEPYGTDTTPYPVKIMSIVPGTGATALGKAEDAPHDSGDVGVMALAVRKDADASLGADGDYAPVQVDATGFAKVNVKAMIALPAGTALIGKVGIDQTTPGTTDGVTATLKASNLSSVIASAANAAISTCTFAAGAAGVKNYCTHLSVFLSAAAAANDINVYLRDGATGGGTIIWRGVIGSGAPRGEGISIPFTSPKVGTAATAMTLDVDAGGTSVVCIASLSGYSI